MGWSGAEQMMEDIVYNVNKILNLTHQQKLQIYLAMIQPIEDQDGELCGLLYSGDPTIKEALIIAHPHWKDEE